MTRLQSILIYSAALLLLMATLWAGKLGYDAQVLIDRCEREALEERAQLNAERVRLMFERAELERALYMAVKGDPDE